MSAMLAHVEHHLKLFPLIEDSITRFSPTVHQLPPALFACEFVQVVRSLVENLSPDHQAIFNYHYLESWPPEKVCLEVGLSRSDFYRKRKGLLYSVARCLGWVESESVQ